MRARNLTRETELGTARKLAVRHYRLRDVAADYRRVALYGVTRLVAHKQQEKEALGRVQLRAPIPGSADFQLVDSMSQIWNDVFAGRINPGSITIVRSIAAPQSPIARVGVLITRSNAGSS